MAESPSIAGLHETEQTFPAENQPDVFTESDVSILYIIEQLSD